ncbi:MAG TPA: IS4 family transposase [Archangium sp.]|uniref:IS4 family transposase n=1 Tax=Archangium sp. TaxID=1872627 RepID=UPI002E30578C|nr:IS4 family transposase [Archangium sp.]HEX5745227.1 IS4 family transposase [Archangium sp.]
MESGQQLEGVLERELAGSGLGHKARHKRLLRIGQAMSRAASASFPRQFAKDEAGLKGAYRFFANPEVTPEAILQGHVAATRERCRARGKVLCIQDTTDLIFKHQVEGAGRINQLPRVRGLWVHTTLAVDAGTHEVMGVLGQMVWARPDKPKRKKRKKEETAAQRKKRPRESQRWGEAAYRVSDVLEPLPAQERPCVVHVLDAEGDVFETLEVIEALGDSFVIRVTRNRLLASGQRQQAEEAEREYLLDKVAQAPVLGHKVVQVPGRPGQQERQAELEIRACRVSVRPPRNRGRAGQPLELNVVLARETRPPEGQKPLYWCLVTGEPIETLQQCLQVVEAYEGRWLVEELHMGFKSGCGTETRRLQHGARLSNFLALATVVAFSMLSLRDAARRPEPPPASEHLSEIQLQLLGDLCPELPPNPNAYDALRAMAMLGGFIGRKGDGEPGWRTLWRGWEKLQHAETIYRMHLHRLSSPKADSG